MRNMSKRKKKQRQKSRMERASISNSHTMESIPDQSCSTAAKSSSGSLKSTALDAAEALEVCDAKPNCDDYDRSTLPTTMDESLTSITQQQAEMQVSSANAPTHENSSSGYLPAPSSMMLDYPVPQPLQAASTTNGESGANSASWAGNNATFTLINQPGTPVPIHEQIPRSTGPTEVPEPQIYDTINSKKRKASSSSGGWVKVPRFERRTSARLAERREAAANDYQVEDLPVFGPHNETTPERTKRLRKEARRSLNLRVSFRRSSSLEDVCLFTTQPEHQESPGTGYMLQEYEDTEWDYLSYTDLEMRDRLLEDGYKEIQMPPELEDNSDSLPPVSPNMEE
ncbi:hypothetical protein K470DRAFT_292382 [Piedraia hortae CBS 480.64]|uniref:Uncharacterized protein n=1 Tax=Piedraia hortae CBS 480.64 TaxID=1314780 RepID=A0A6A7C9T3_9PEZI|nr:hypothetical protein K470DRAFT_292382 [Piedraia hortae CBS 480.64]